MEGLGGLVEGLLEELEKLGDSQDGVVLMVMLAL